MKKLLTLAVLSVLATSSFAEDRSGMYLTDTAGNVVPDAYGLCVRTGFWTVPTPATATAADCKCEKVCKPVPVAAKAVAPSVKPTVKKMTLQAEMLFDFNKSTIRSDGAAMLDEAVAHAKKTDVEVIIAVGHADRIGSAAYNKTLSEKRAAAVKAYFVDKGLPANLIYTEGKGETQPVTSKEQCKGAKDLKACLQPDRRVDIEIIGTTK